MSLKVQIVSKRCSLCPILIIQITSCSQRENCWTTWAYDIFHRETVCQIFFWMYHIELNKVIMIIHCILKQRYYINIKHLTVFFYCDNIDDIKALRNFFPKCVDLVPQLTHFEFFFKVHSFSKCVVTCHAIQKYWEISKTIKGPSSKKIDYWLHIIFLPAE